MWKKRRNRIIGIVLLVLVLITIMRETGLVNLNWYHNNIQSTTYTNWNDQGFSYEAAKSTIDDSLLRDRCNYASMQEVPVEVWCNDYLMGDTGLCQRASVFVSDIHFGWVYSPLYKSTHFSAEVICSSPLRFYTEHDSTVTVHGVNLSGNISVQGNITIWGFMSARSAKEQIREFIAKEIYNQVVAHLQHTK